MDDGKYAYLVCVDGQANSNKFYEMKQISPYEFVATWGREDSTRTPGSKTYPMHQWQSVYNKRVNKHSSKSYTDVTHLRAEEIIETDSGEPASISTIKDSAIRRLLANLQAFASGSVKRNYKVSSDAVTQAQMDEAQGIIDQISGMIYTPDTRASNVDINYLLEDLYTVVPRRMSRVADHMLPYESGLDLERAKNLLNTEQDNIDVMSQQVRSHVRDATPSPAGDDKPSKSILDDMGIVMRVATLDEVKMVKQMTQGDTGRIGTVYAVTNQATRSAFEDHLQSMRGIRLRTAKFWHGSRNENWLYILDEGLRIRPPRATSTGSMFGIGIYFADKFSKSFNYTSYQGSYYAHGTQTKGFMAVFDVHIGKQYEVGRHSSSCYDLTAKKLAQLGDYDSVWGKSGYSLLNNEYIVYQPQQCTVAYLVELV